MFAIVPPTGTKYILFLKNSEKLDDGYLGQADSIEAAEVGVIYVPKDKSPHNEVWEILRYKLENGQIFYHYEVDAYQVDPDNSLLRMRLKRLGIDHERLLGPPGRGYEI